MVDKVRIAYVNNPYIPTQIPEEDKKQPSAVTGLIAHFICSHSLTW